jgi:diguanylate cyclase (GGDEF)-like protein/PAS domain S-box-containing protein
LTAPDSGRGTPWHLWIGVALAALTAWAGWWFTGFVERTGDRIERERVQALAVTAAAALDPADIAALRGDAAEAGTPVLERVRVELQRVHAVNPGFRFVYLMRPSATDPQQLVFLADAEPSDSPDYSAPGDVYDGPSETLLQVYRSGRPAIEEPARDRWGYWVTGLAPVRDPRSGLVLAVLGMDINADAWLAERARQRSYALTIAGLGLALVLLFTLGLQLQQRAARHIGTINARLERQLAELERAQEGLRQAGVVFKHTGEGIVVLDPEFRVQIVNPGFSRIVGRLPAEVVGRPLDLLDGDGETDGLGLLRARLRSVDEWEGTLGARRRDGEGFPMEAKVDAVRDESGVLRCYVLVFHDATAQKRLEDGLRQLSATDGLTGVANRRAFDEALEKEWHRAMRSNEPLSLVMADIDLFKAYNDHYGHVAGDDCLRRVAAAIADCAKRSGDLVARYGGEEFAVILPRTDAAAAREIAERIRQRVEALGIPHAGNPAGGHITISLGISTRTPPQNVDFVSLMQGADQALYKAKESGRNTVVS